MSERDPLAETAAPPQISYAFARRNGILLETGHEDGPLNATGGAGRIR